MRRLILATLAALGLVLVAAAPANANTYGWKWAEVVDVYDGTGGGNWQVAEAAAEWAARSGLVTRMTSDPATANILVREGTAADCGTTQAIAGCSWQPPTSSGVAHGTSTVYLMAAYRDAGVAEFITIHEMGHSLGLAHTDNKRSVMRAAVDRYDYFTAPQSADYRDMKALYGR